jgi:phosphoglycerate dehydrogenase-like enzyme
MTESSAAPRVVLGEWQHDEGFRRAITTPVTLIPAPTLRDEDIAPLLRGADAFVSKRFTPGMAAAADRLRLILTPGAGTNQIDFAAVPAGVTVCNVYGHEAAIAEYAFMAMLALNRDLLNMDARFRRADWSDRTERETRPEIAGRTLGVVGLGRIGSEVARIGRAFGMRVVAVTRTLRADRAEALGLADLGGMADLPRLLAEADFVVLAVPLEASTTGLIGAAELAAMKPSAFLVNVARGEVVAEAALFEALRDGRIAGAAIDTWYRYPEANESVRPSAFPFHELPNAIVTPHIAGWTAGTFRHRWETIAENLRRLSSGEPFLGVVWPPADGGSHAA